MKQIESSNSKDIQKEFEDFIKNKFGGQVQFLADELKSFSEKKTEKEVVKETQAEEKSDESRFDFSLNPKAVKAYLDRFVVGQDQAKKALSIAVCDHYSHVAAAERSKEIQESNYSKQNVLITGPSGVGKTYMIKQIANLLGVPFVKADATRFSETGYMGANVDDLIKDLVDQADGDLEKAQTGIIYLDEADKLAGKANSAGRDVNGRGVQMGLLKLMEETDVDLRAANDPSSQMQMFFEMQKKGKSEKQVVNTKHILFIVSGAFTGLDEIIAKRVQSNRVGFSLVSEREEDLSKKDLLAAAKVEDFVEYGFEPEFIGRLPVRVSCEALDEGKLFEILKFSEGSILKQYTRTFGYYGIELTYTDSALRFVSHRAALDGTGARALMTVCEELLREFKFELPGSGVSRLCFDENLAKNPQQHLNLMIADLEETDPRLIREIRDFESEYLKTHGFSIEFDLKACRELCKLSHKNDELVPDLCARVLSDYEHGLKLILQNKGQENFVFGPEVVLCPEESIERLVASSYCH